MIVKNEAPVIKRCLETVKPWINTWVILDTGSNDGTQTILKECMRSIPGELIERPWVDFSHNRNETLSIAKHKADYSLFIDADEQFIQYRNLNKLPTDKDVYFIKVNERKSFHQRAFLLNNASDIRWQGVLHECLVSNKKYEEGFFDGGEILSLTEQGNRGSDPQKYLKDALVLENALKNDPQNSRYLFFLAQSYSNAKEYALALRAYEKRSQIGGSKEEIFFSLFMVGCLQDQLHYDPQICAKSFFTAHKICPYRHEPLYGISLYYIKNKKFNEAYKLLSKCNELICFEDSIFYQTHIKNHLIPYLLIQCCYQLKMYQKCFSLGKILLAQPDLPEEIFQNVKLQLSILKNEIPALEIQL